MGMHRQETTKKLGVCYYPEQWDEETWANDADRMAKLGIKLVRIGEFAWSRLEPSRGDYRFDWLERAIETLNAANLDVVIGTPTATPPKWLVDEIPDMLPVGETGQVRKFGSRRHYSFSHPGYRQEYQFIVTELAKRRAFVIQFSEANCCRLLKTKIRRKFRTFRQDEW
jgi:beta-galactosidase